VASNAIAAAFAGVFLVLGIWGYLRRPRRSAFWFAAACAGSAATAAFYDAFWPMVSFGVFALWGSIVGLGVVDLSWRIRFGLVLSLALVGFVALWPSLHAMSGGRLPCPGYIQDRVEFRLVAGLDLRGGLRLVYAVDVDEAIKDKRFRYYEEMQALLAKAYGLHDGDKAPDEGVLQKLRERVNFQTPRRPANQIIINFKDAADVEAKIDARFRDQFRGDLGEPKVEGARVTYQIRDAVESAIRERAVSQAREIILRRVDELGLREASVSTRDEDIIVEVPGQDEATFTEIRDIISQTARLEFKMVDDDSSFFFDLKQRAEQDKALATSLPDGLEFLVEVAPVGLNDQGERVTKQVTYAYLERKREETSQQALARLKEWAESLELPSDRELGYELEYRTVDEVTLEQEEAGWRTYLLRTRADITGDMIRDAAAVPDQGDRALGGWHVQVTFTDQGGRIFDRVTAANVKRRFAIILDGRTESAPEILTRIAGGVASITLGTPDPEEQLRDARKLELVLRSGALPAPISPTNEQRIGPSLGRDSIRLAVEGGMAGSALVLLFMFLYYRRAGLIADLSVSLNLFLQLAILASFGASMTLPGIAGLALTIGMSVDCNVLINERIREELRDGKGARAAVDVGYRKALSAIVDGHLTTLISGVVLAQYGTGPVKGIAVTLIVGVLTSIFSGVVVSRVLFDLWVRRMGRQAKLNMG
jgi:preprotein translocase subunit SecD